MSGTVGRTPGPAVSLPATGKEILLAEEQVVLDQPIVFDDRAFVFTQRVDRETATV